MLEFLMVLKNSMDSGFYDLKCWPVEASGNYTIDLRCVDLWMSLCAQICMCRHLCVLLLIKLLIYYFRHLYTAQPSDTHYSELLTISLIYLSYPQNQRENPITSNHHKQKLEIKPITNNPKPNDVVQGELRSRNHFGGRMSLNASLKNLAFSIFLKRGRDKT